MILFRRLTFENQIKINTYYHLFTLRGNMFYYIVEVKIH